MNRYAIICPCGPLWKWGYENTAGPCLRNQASHADALYLVHSAKQPLKADIQGDNIVSLSDSSTWFHPQGLAPDEIPFIEYAGAVFTHLHNRNYLIGQRKAWLDGYRAVVYSQSSWYITDQDAGLLQAAIEQLLKKNQTYGLVNRRGQLGNVVLRPDKAAYLIVNMTGWSEDEAGNRMGDRKLRGELVGNYPAFVDCGSEETPMQLVQHLWRARAERYTPEYLVAYSRKIALMGMPGEPVTDQAGLEIAQRSRPEYLSQQTLMRPNNET